MYKIVSTFKIHPQERIDIRITRSITVDQDVAIIEGQDFFIGSFHFKVCSVIFETTKGEIEKIILLKLEAIPSSKKIKLNKILDEINWK